MRERTLIIGTTIGGIVVSFLVSVGSGFLSLAFRRQQSELLHQQDASQCQCEKVSKKQCERVCGQEVEKCEECFRRGSQGVVGRGVGSTNGPSVTPP